jgi:hypothetical protein
MSATRMSVNLRIAGVAVAAIAALGGLGIASASASPASHPAHPVANSVDAPTTTSPDNNGWQ